MVATSKVVIIGGGFGGLQCAKHLKKGSAEVMVIDRTNHHLFQPLLYQVASAALSPGDIAIPIREVMRKQKNAVTLMGEVVEINKEEKYIEIANGNRIRYDYLVVAVGARHSYFGNDQWECFAPGLKALPDALNIRERLLKSFEEAERCDSISESEKWLNFVVIGGGPTGVEMAGAISEIAYKTMIRDFKRVNIKKTKIYLIEGTSKILPTFPTKLGNRARKDLEKMGIEVITEQLVSEINEDGVQVGERFIPAKNVIWAAGNQASPLLKTLDVPLDRAGRAIVGPDCSVPGHPNVFVIGDAACYEGDNGRPLPGIAPVAVQQAHYVAKIIRKKLSPRKRPRFAYFDKGMMATIGTHKAVCAIEEFQFTGLPAWFAWGFIHIAYLIGFRNRFLVMMQWFMQYFTKQRGARLIRTPLEEEDQTKEGN